MDESKYEVLKLENQLCFPLYAASREVIKKYRPLLDALGLTYTQYITMMVLWEHKKINAKELGQKLFLDSGTLTPVLKSLEAKGLVHRRRSVDDERVLTVEITKKGMALREQALPIPTALTSCVKLQSQEAVQLYELLNKVLKTLNDPEQK
ncbi:MAG: MarR family transcriptional regulator [Clostridia bacterium]|nr:MarR family transcriptional regulator [Clostridia bacterium]